MKTKLLLQHELMLLAIRDDVGTFSGGMFLYSIAGAMVSELLIQERIVANDDKKQTVAVVDESPTGDSILDELLQKIAASKKNHGLQRWVQAGASIPKLKHRVAEQLCEIGALKRDERKVLWLFTQQVYPELDGSWENSVRNRMGKFMFHEGAEPDSATAILIALAKHSGLLEANFPKEELRQHKDRIVELASGDILANSATKGAITAVQTAVMVATMVPIMAAST